jgi:hypothetical protein
MLKQKQLNLRRIKRSNILIGSIKNTDFNCHILWLSIGGLVMSNFDKYDVWNVGAIITAAGVGIKITAPFVKKAWMKVTGNRYATVNDIKDVYDEIDNLESKTVDAIVNMDKKFDKKLNILEAIAEKLNVEPEKEKPEKEKPEKEKPEKEEESDENDEA